MTPRGGRTRKGERTLEALLEQASVEFASRGYHAASVAAICRRAGMTNAAFYRYFQDKREVHDALVARAREALAEAVGASHHLADLCERIFDCLERHGREFQVFREAEFLAEAGTPARAFYDPVVHRIRGLLGVDEATAWALLGAQIFVALRFGLWTRAEVPREVRSAFLDFVTGGLAPGSFAPGQDVTLQSSRPRPWDGDLADGVLAATPEAGDRADRTRRALIAAARFCFATRGYSATPVAAITMRAQVALGTFYLYFPGKRDVLEWVVDEIRSDIMERASEAGADAPNWLERERRSLLVFLEWLRTNGDIYRIVREAEFAEPAIGRAYYERIGTAYSQGLGAAMPRGEVRRLDADVVGWALMGVAHFAGLRWVLWEPGRAAPPEAIAATLRFLQGGLRACQPFPGGGDPPGGPPPEPAIEKP